MTRIQLLVANDGDREALATLLADQYTVVTDDELADVDCYLVEDVALPEYRDTLREHKLQSHPVFCPVVLIEQSDSRIDVDSPAPDHDADGVRLVDDTVSAPVERAVLGRRLQNLLTRRRQSISLAREHERSEARFRGLFEGLSTPAFVLDDGQAVTECNEAFCGALGVDREDTIGRALDSIPGLALDVTALQDALTVDDTDSEGAHVIEYGNGQYGVLTTRTETVDGETSTICVLSDITELKEKTERLDRFASVLSHDLRNPLQVAQMRTRLLKEEQTYEQDHIDSIEIALDRIQDLIRKLLTVARTGTNDLDREDLTVSSTVRSAWRTVETDGARLVVDVPDDAVLYADRERLLQLFENLFCNSVEHAMPATEAERDVLTVRVSTSEDGFSVEDDGPGIPPSERDEVLQMGVTNDPDGSGLGLGIVSKIAEVHDWQLHIVDGSEGGTRFEFAV